MLGTLGGLISYFVSSGSSVHRIVFKYDTTHTQDIPLELKSDTLVDKENFRLRNYIASSWDTIPNAKVSESILYFEGNKSKKEVEELFINDSNNSIEVIHYQAENKMRSTRKLFLPISISLLLASLVLFGSSFLPKTT